MNAIRRMSAAALAAGVTVALGASTAGAATVAVPGTPEVFLGSASASGLALDLVGQTLTVGAGQAKVTSQLLSSASGTAVMSVLGSTTSQAQLSGTANGAITDGPRCNPQISLQGVLVLNNACTTSSSTMSSGLGHALTHATVDGADLNVNTLLSSTPLGQVSQTLTQTLQTVVNQLPTPVQLDPVKNTVGGVLNDVLKTQTAHLTIGDSLSEVTGTAGQIVSTASAKGGELDILPAPTALNGAIGPLASVIIGSSSATATYNRSTGKSVASFDPALITVKLGATPATPAVSIPVTVGQTQTIALPAGLGSLTLQVADGSTFHNPDGTVGAVANAVKVALQLLNQPVINLSIAGAQATVAGAPPVAAVPAPPTPAGPIVQPSQPLPHTGGFPWMPLAGGGILAAFLVTRRLRITAAR